LVKPVIPIPPVNFKKIVNGTERRNSIKFKKFGFFSDIRSNFSKNQDKMKNYIKNKLDICNYLDGVRKIDLIRILVMNQAQNLCLNFLKKPNAYDIEELENFNIKFDISHNKDKDLIMDYYAKKSNANQLDDIDQKLMKLVKL
jgi:hypothetical protein